MSVEIDPQELSFQRPFNTEVTQILKIKNPNRQPVAFKVKTTAPKQYCVRPNSGRIEPGKEVEVTVILQPFKIEPAADAKCKDKFLVQSVLVTPDKEFVNANVLWQHSEDDSDKASVQEKKIRVVYLSVGGAAPANLTPMKNGTDGTNGNAPPVYRSPSPEQSTYTPDNRSSVTSAPVGPSVKLEDKPFDAKSLNDAKVSTFNPQKSSPLATAGVPESYEELKAKLAEAQAAISAYAQEGGLRMRKVAAGETGNKTVDDVAHQVAAGAQGVSIPITAFLCLISFLLAYFFF